MTSDQEAANAFSASVLPVGIQQPGDNVVTPKGGANQFKNKVIVVFKAGTPASEIEDAVKNVEAQGGIVTHRYNSALLGFAAEIPDNHLQALTVHPKVDYVEPDGEVSIYAKSLLK
ncbi:hypothetical protein BGX23_010923 [Mortierella sp. AD031]|nr:hypothetical protein BGX23_010923 [Mortierella sp. AD031]